MDSMEDERSIDWAPRKILELQEQLDDLKAVIFSDSGDNRITKAHRRISDEAWRIYELGDQAARLEQGIASLSEQGNADRDRLNSVVGAINERLDRGVVPSALREEAYERGYSAGISAAIDEAESRVRAYMENHFSTGTINGVINALRGSKIGGAARQTPK